MTQDDPGYTVLMRLIQLWKEGMSQWMNSLSDLETSQLNAWFERNPTAGNEIAVRVVKEFMDGM